MPSSPVAHDALVQIVERASTLWERLGDDYLPVGGAEATSVAAGRFDRWCQVAAEGDRDVFARRLEWDGLDEARVRGALGPVRLKDDQSLPGWATVFRDLVTGAYGTGATTDGDPDGLPSDAPRSVAPLPFDDLLAPLVAAASRRLAPRAAAHRHLLSAEAYAALEWSLLQRLARLCAECLHLEFTAFRARRTTSFGRLLARASSAPGTDLYREFVAEMRRGGMIRLFAEYPRLARAVATVAAQWVDRTAEFLVRLAADLPALRADLNGDTPTGRVVDLRCNLSDPHDGGRSTLLLTFASGLKVVYKSRDLATEAHWFALLGWLNGRGAALPFRCLKVRRGDDHGWMEYAAHRPCADEAEARRYYTRTGALLCLVYALGGNDCHFENIVAAGEHPILVDLETIMHPTRRDGADTANPLQRAVGRARFESVLRTGMLPQWIPRSGGRALDTSALGAVAETETTRALPRWRDVNTDAMRLEREHYAAPPGQNAPMVDGAPLSPNDYVPEIEAGFRQMYRALVEWREEMLAPDGPLAAMRDQSIRFIFRGTGVYYAVAERANRPEQLRDGAAHSVELDALCRAPLLEADRPRFWPLLAAERRALEQGDIPHFLATADSDGLRLGPGAELRGCFDEPCYAQARARLLRMDARDLERQVGFIRATMLARVARHGQRGGGRAVPDSELDLVTPPASDVLVADAIAIAAAIRDAAIGDPDDAVTWMTVRYDFSMQRFQLEVSGPGLYDGGCGIALFLSALERVTGGAGVRGLALAALAPLREELRSRAPRRLAAEVGVGGASGAGAFVYGLTRVAGFLGEGDLLEDARRAAAAITDEAIAADGAYDVIGGSAGAILGLLALHDATGDGDVLARAVACGHHLVAHQAPPAADGRGWANVDGRVLAGFAHGAAGIAYALLRLHDTTGEAAFREAATEAIRYETARFSATERNWPDLREWTPGRPYSEFAVSWCNGGPGIGLARLGGLRSLDTPAIRADIAAAAESACHHGADDADHLCCGNLGRADALLEIGRRLDRPDLVGAARRRVAHARSTAAQRGGYRLWWQTGGGVSLPGLFQGTSGIGYALLRSASPESLPSVLLWE